MKAKAAFVLGAGIGYVFGTRAGRQQFERIKGWASDAWQDPRVQSTVEDLESTAARFAKDQGSALKDKAVDAVKGAVQRGGKDDPWSEDAPAPTSGPTSTTPGTTSGTV